MSAILMGISGMAARSDGLDLTEVARLPLHNPTPAVAWSTDGSHLAAIVGSDVVIWDATSWAQQRRFPVLRRLYVGQSLAYVDGGLLVGAPDQIAPYNGLADAYVPAPAILLWDPVTGSPLRSFPNPTQRSPDGPTHPQDIFAVSDDGKQIVAVDGVSMDATVFLYDTNTGAILHAVSAPQVPRPAPQFAPTPQPNPRIQELFSAVAFSPKGNAVGACGFSGRVYIINALTGAMARIFPAYEEGVRCSALAFSADGKLLATGRESRRHALLGHQPRPGEQSALEADTGNVRVWEVASGKMIASFPNAVGTTRTLSWSRADNTLVAGDDGSLKRWTFEGEIVSKTACNPVPGGVLGTSFSPDGRLAVLRGDASIVIYR